MKANLAPLSRVMRRRPALGLGLAGGLLLALSSCAVPVQQAPVAAPSPLPAEPAPNAAVAHAPPPDWRSADLTPGQWSWAMAGGASQASFGVAGQAPVLQIGCPRPSGAVEIKLAVFGQGQSAEIGILASSQRRDFFASREFSDQRQSERFTVAVPARDHFLDALAFTRGRFAIEGQAKITGGLRLYLPAHPAISRVVEDCRAAGLSQ